MSFGVPLLDAYLEFLAVRSRANTVAAVAYDLKVFFTVVGKPPAEVTAADVLAFVTAQYIGGAAVRLACPTDRRRGSSRGVPRTEVRCRHRRPDAAVDVSAHCDLTQPEFVVGDLIRPNQSSALRVSCKRRGSDGAVVHCPRGR